MTFDLGGFFSSASATEAISFDHTERCFVSRPDGGGGNPVWP